MVLRGRALYDFDATEDAELSFRAGNVLEILVQDPSGWWQASLNGQKGMIPGNYVEVLEEERPAAPVRAAKMADVDLLSAAPPTSESVLSPVEQPEDDTTDNGSVSGPTTTTSTSSTAPKKMGKVETKVAELLAKMHQGGLAIREKITRLDDRHGVTQKVKEFDQKHSVSDRAHEMDGKVTRWEKDFKADTKVQATQEKVFAKVNDWAEKRPELKAKAEKALAKTNEVLETIGEKAGILAKKIGDTSVFQSLSKSVKKLGDKLADKASGVAGKTGELVAAQEENERN